jgi:putative radical SAM enzyme (TIGR03279 family)
MTKRIRSHRSRSLRESKGGLVARILPGSIAEDLGLQAGDRVLAVGGHPLRDIIDYRFAIAEEQIELLVHTSSGVVACDIEKEPDEDLGIAFAEPLFDHLHRCGNACMFCFITQMPANMRSSLYVKDDDYRLSFLYGNFITLTNLRESDWERIGEQHLSPLYLSVHATDPALRAAMMGRRRIPDILAQIRRLGRLGIQVHAQVVACPGLNDGEALDRTIEDLARLHPVVQSIAVVPVGLTRCSATLPHPGRDAPLRGYLPTEAARLVDQIMTYGNRYRRRLGVRLVYPADELLLLSNRDIPAASFYDGSPQYFNGVGMTRDFLDAWEQTMPRCPSRLVLPAPVALVCGTLIAPTIQRLVNQLRGGGPTIQVVPVPNRFFGETVTVSGLLTGQDVTAALRSTPGPYDHVLLPRAMFDHEGVRTLDDYTIKDIAREIRRPVSVIGNPEELLRFVNGLTGETEQHSTFGGSGNEQRKDYVSTIL